MVKPGWLAAILGVALVAIPSGRATAAGDVGIPVPSAVSGADGYRIDVISCSPTYPQSGSCGQILDESTGRSTLSSPTLAIFGCYSYVDGQLAKEAFVVVNSLPAALPFMPGTHGVAGVSRETGGPGAATWEAVATNLLTGSSSTSPAGWAGSAGTTTGTSIGLIQIDNKTGQVTGGRIHISLSGSIYLMGKPVTQTHGSLSCDITGPSNHPVSAFASAKPVEGP